MFKMIFGGLCLSLVVIILLAQSNIIQSDNISVIDAHKQSMQGKLVLIDIRAQNEWAKTGVAPQALTLSMHEKDGLAGFSKRLMSVLDGDKTKAVALICAGGIRSLYLQYYLKRQGFTQIINVNEGMVGGVLSTGWIDQNLPTKAYLSPIAQNPSALNYLPH